MKHLGIYIRQVGAYVEVKITDNVQHGLLNQQQLKELREDIKEALENIEYHTKEKK